MKIKTLKKETKNLLNNQNYILWKTEKKKLLSKFFVENINNKINSNFNRINNYLFRLYDNIFLLFFVNLVLFFILIWLPIYIITIFTYEWIYLISETFDILLITFLLVPSLIILLYKIYFWIPKYKLLNKLFYPLILLINIISIFYSIILVLILNLINWYSFIKYKPLWNI